MDHSEILHETLDNGLTILLRETHRAPVANLQIWARVGSADERAGEGGLAHFHEHMLFKGTPTRGVGAVAGEVEGAGGRINAYTSFDVTVYYATLPSSALPVGLDVLSDAILHSVFDSDEVQREREVVLEEIRRSEDHPGHVLSDLTFKEAYREHPYGAPILGPPENVAAFDRAKVMRFFDRWYRPDNLVVVAAGDFDKSAVRDAIVARFGDAAPGDAERARTHESPHRGLKAVVERRPFEGQRVELAWPSARFRDEDAVHLDLLAYLLGECESSRLVRDVKDQAGLADRIDASSYTPLDRGLFTIGLETDEARVRGALEAVADQVERLRREPVSQAELERARANFLASEHFERESVSGLASKLGHFQVLGDGWQSEADYFEALGRATTDDLLRVAQTYLDPEELVAAALIPDTDHDRLDAAALESAVRAGFDRARRALPEAAIAAPRSNGTTRAGGGEASAAGGGDATQIETFDLDGLRLHVLPRRSVPVVALRAVAHGGLLAEDESNAGLGSFLASMWTRGTAKRSAADFASAIEDLAAEVDGFSGRSSCGLTLESTSASFDRALDLFAEVALEPGFHPEEIERERRETLAAFDRLEDQLAQRAFMLFAETEFETHPYRLPLIGRRKVTESLDASQVRAHHDRLLAKPGMVVAVSGDVDPDHVARAWQDRLGGLRTDAPALPEVALEARGPGVREAHIAKDRAQAHLVIGFRGLSVDDPDRHTLEVISQLLAGQGGRLFLELRDRQSLAYSVNATNVEGVHPGFFAVYIGTAPDKLETARRGIFEELERLLEAAPSEGELDRARLNLAGNFAIDLQRNSSLATHMSLDDLYGLGPKSYERYADEVLAISREDCLRVARQVIRLDAYTEALVAP